MIILSDNLIWEEGHFKLAFIALLIPALIFAAQNYWRYFEWNYTIKQITTDKQR